MDNDHAGPSPSLQEVGERLRRDLELLRDTLQRPVHELQRAAARFVDEHPLAAVGAAVGVGYVLAGGLFSRVTLRLTAIGTRFVVSRLLKEILTAAGVGLLLAKEQAAPRGTDPSEARR
jgi:hypothetical protein